MTQIKSVGLKFLSNEGTGKSPDLSLSSLGESTMTTGNISPHFKMRSLQIDRFLNVEIVLEKVLKKVTTWQRSPIHNEKLRVLGSVPSR
jgi:hypothetical protein